jgi:hypothetical protein
VRKRRDVPSSQSTLWFCENVVPVPDAIAPADAVTLLAYTTPLGLQADRIEMHFVRPHIFREGHKIELTFTDLGRES